MQAATAIGDDGSIPYTLAHLALTRCLAGDLTEAATLAEEGHELSVQAGLGSERALELAVRAFIAAHRGEADLCRSLAGEAVAEGEQRSLRVAVITGRSAIALLELSLGDFAAAESQLAGLDAELAAAGVGNPGGLRFVPDYVQALVGLGELDRARAAIDRYEDHAVRLDRPAARASALRCRGLIAIAAGDAEGAQQAFAAALRQHERRLLPIDRARTLLAQGAALRRAKRKKAAREVLGQAHAAFTAHGTQIFAAAAARELSSIGGRASARGLTPSELRVAELVAAGRTNREVAAALFLAERTVEGHLSRVYSKLGVRSRTELSRALPAED